MVVTLLDGPAFFYINTLARLGQGETVGTSTTRRERERGNNKTKQKTIQTTTLHVHHTFLYFFAVFARLQRENA